MQTSNINIMLDLSILGNCYANGDVRAGIPRYLTHLFEGLMDTEDCRINPCACGYRYGPWNVAAFLSSRHPDFEQDMLYSQYQRTLIERLDSLDNRVKSRQSQTLDFLKIRREVLRIILKTILASTKPLDSKQLEESHIYHSPFTPIPDQVRKRSRVKRFLTVHDLIPTRFPHLYTE